MALNDLYRDYGRLLIEFEILQGKVNQIKKQIFEEIKEVDEADDTFISRPITKE